MRDTFYHWITVALLNAVFFGAHLARAQGGKLDLFYLAAHAGIGALATAGAVQKFRRAKAGEDA